MNIFGVKIERIQPEPPPEAPLNLKEDAQAAGQAALRLGKSLVKSGRETASELTEKVKARLKKEDPNSFLGKLANQLGVS